MPISHLALVETVEDALRATGLKIGDQVHSLSEGGARYFGLTEVRGQSEAEDYTWVFMAESALFLAVARRTHL